MAFGQRVLAGALSAKAALVNWTRPGAPLKLDDPRGWFGGGRQGVSTRRVTDDDVLSLTAAWRSVKLISETIGALPLHLMRRTNDVPVKATEHPLYDRLHSRASKFQTSSALIEQIAMSLCLWNQAYIRPRGIGSYVELGTISPAFVRAEAIDNGTDVRWHASESGRTSVLELGEIVPIDGFRWPGALEGMAVAGMQREAFALAMSAEDYGMRFFASGGRPTGVLTTDTILTKDQRERLRTSYATLLKGIGAEGVGGIHVMEGGMKYQAVSSTPEDSQFLGTRKASVLEVSRIFGVPPHMLGELDRATYANSEQNNREFLTYTLLPYLRRIENAINAFLLSERDRKNYFAKFSVEGLLRADSAGRAAFYREGRAGSWLTPNEIRAFEDLPRVEGADDLHVPLNMAPIDQLAEIVGSKTTGGDA